MVGDTIAEVSPRSPVTIRPGAVVIDGSGKYLVPGLIDGHVHVETASFARAFGLQLDEPIPYANVLFPYLAHGVTSVRVMSGAPDVVEARDRVRRGELVGPDMLVASPMLDGRPPVLPEPMTRVVTTAESARQAVREFQSQGYDFIKIRAGLTRPLYDAIIAEARQTGIPVDGHVPRGEGMSLEHALSGGQDGIAHLEEFTYAVQRFDDATIDRITRQVATSGVFVATTLTVFPSIIAQLSNLDSLLQQPEMATVYPMVLDAFWRPPGNPYVSSGDLDPAFLRRSLGFQRRLARSLYDAGVPLLAGSDALNPIILPGKGLWNELAELVKSGFSPYEAMRTATVNPAARFPEYADRGVIEPGRRADLVLLAMNPLDSIEHLATEVGVMIAGHWLPIEAIRSRLSDIASDYARKR